MFLSTELTAAVELVLKHGGVFDGPVQVAGRVASGLTETMRLRSGDRSWFLKCQQAERYPRMLQLEALALRSIGATSTVHVPRVLGSGLSGGQQFLVLEWIQPGPDTAQAHARLGRQLARLHRTTAGTFGQDYDNYIGTLVQRNDRRDNWTDFFTAMRLEPLLQTADEKGLIDRSMRAEFDAFISSLDRLYPKEPPALLHGDLWNGNFLVAPGGDPVLVDPAIYYGHREMDLAMSVLFGEFGPEFYDAYQEEYPLEKGWRERLEFWNLYPRLVHLILFGRGYLPGIRSSLEAVIARLA
ncbi:MAG TPA: fructosamine kinase family protein [Sphingobacteriaceae bacterium]